MIAAGQEPLWQYLAMGVGMFAAFVGFGMAMGSLVSLMSTDDVRWRYVATLVAGCFLTCVAVSFIFYAGDAWFTEGVAR